MYSSKPVDGKPLFAWAKEGKSDEVDVPETKLKISSISFDGVRSVSSEDIHTYIKESVNAVNGDFRQDAILGKWNDFFADDKTRVATFTVVSLTVNCESGSYMRSLAVEIGKDIGAPALALKIVRTRVGEYCAENFNK
jgi:tRNA U55 pseudouridine synthase TruB